MELERDAHRLVFLLLLGCLSAACSSSANGSSSDGVEGGTGGANPGADAAATGPGAANPGSDAASANPGSTSPGTTHPSGVDAAAAGSGEGGFSPSDAGGSSAVDGSTLDGGSAPVSINDYEARGPYTVKVLLNQGPGTIPNGSAAQYPTGANLDKTALTVFVPDNAAAGETFPLLSWGNGTLVVPTYYTQLIEHVVSHGFVVVGANDSMVGDGQSILKAVDWAKGQAMVSGSPLYGKIDVNHVGAFGHSQGGEGTCMAGLDARINAIAPLSGIPLDTNTFNMAAAALKIPGFFVTSYNEATMGTNNVIGFYNAVTAPAVYGVLTMGTDHNSYGDIASDPHVGIGGAATDGRDSRGAIAAWFDWQLKGKTAVRALFVGPNCGYCPGSPGSTWTTMTAKGF